MVQCKNYYLGLDIGTDSVGYAVADRNYTLLKRKGEPMWGTHLFEGGRDCAERRGYRTNRRRIDRRQQRVAWLTELFAPQIIPIDPYFSGGERPVLSMAMMLHMALEFSKGTGSQMKSITRPILRFTICS